MNDTALRIAAIIAFGLQQFDEATQEEQARTGKSAAELLDTALDRTLANEELGTTLTKKFASLETPKS